MTSLPIQDGGPHDVRSKMAAPTTPRWRPHEVRYEMAAPVTRSVTPRRVSQRPRPREGSVTSWSAVSFFFSIYKGEGPLMYRTNTDLEESILRISGCFFLRSSERDPVFNGVARRSARFIPFPGWTLFFQHGPFTSFGRVWRFLLHCFAIQ